MCSINPMVARFLAREAWNVHANDDARDWTALLRGPVSTREDAVQGLHRLLEQAADFELSRRRHQLGDVSSSEIDHLATEAADDAMTALLDHLDDYQGRSRFTTWAYKFVVRETRRKVLRRSLPATSMHVSHYRAGDF